MLVVVGQQYRVGCSGASCVALIPLWKACVALVWPVWAVTSSCVCDHSADSVADVGMSTAVVAASCVDFHLQLLVAVSATPRLLVARGRANVGRFLSGMLRSAGLWWSGMARVRRGPALR